MIQFILNNEVVKTSAHIGITLLDFIRENKQLKGTKIGCREGDCGACTVLVGTLNNGSISYQSITSCISPLGNASGKHIVTVEGINLPEELNVVQNAMVDNYATQCGFCTPGFVVSMTGYAISSTKENSNNNCTDAISGNICRCTGYKSIEKAATLVSEKLEGKNANNKIEWLIDKGFIPDYFKTIPEKLKQLVIARSEERTTWQSLGRESQIVANGTDLYVQKADVLSEATINLIADDKSLKGISFTEDICTIGSNTTVTELLEHVALNNIFPNLRSFLKLVSSEQIRNMGTLGGNFVNASPIGDMSIFFLALNSSLSIIDSKGIIRKIPFCDFHQDYKKVDLKSDELVHSISFDTWDKQTFFNFEKVSKRTHLDIASVNSAVKISIQNDIISDVHISLGGVAAIPKYLKKTNEFLIGKKINAETIIEAERILQSEITPISDVRGSTEYKRLLAKQLFFAHFVELFPSKIKIKELI
ncbi:MAG: FAD binding domain-containing protein [Urechidicola sp.]|nr:FAD binding domain-containing protein [Urechidicola sp.]